MKLKRMKQESLSRRSFLIASSGMVALPKTASALSETNRLHLACNQYPWNVFYHRAGIPEEEWVDRSLREMADCGIDGYEPLIEKPDGVDTLIPKLKDHGLEMRSLYVNSELHEEDRVEASIESVLAIARKSLAAGTRLIVTNPSPIRWGGTEDKDDHQLRCQASALNRLGEALDEMGLQLAYHNHDLELRQGAREFHHMMVGTDPHWVKLCLDAHWIYRGAGDSQVALFDIVELYGRRIAELHVRQSKDGIWCEYFQPGDIDYLTLTEMLSQLDLRPHIALEQAVEEGSPNNLNALAAHSRSVEYAREVLAPLAD